ncbi:TrmJ/YjtD family RNA methyltransferase [Halosegnis rubeus]|jgi:TrmH family RNA methyltransferase|uniref:TrmJ/YjtD family RNA methyltransferase n=1 Tax=Halosegnis rubeus TaxID=2212850 RepID=A0A5N5U2V6_9EURY|nr:RNA methyltransferase [Halosegnis rubeus]KAB7512791.1 TrmJ/YjtD family RNA methyltransferase [Halosegnis rubeus]KAB7512906.1 TrmJ/YjtD family RNA methyltransferase [Halosegnis rubeus]KAB7515073.1 TrmJ/YjtD family RNA methyltransferase [Halosegnis rubeus]
MIAVAVVGAETPGNVGTIARAMKNFGLSDLYLVDPPELDPEGDAYGFAGHAREDVLPNATETTLDGLTERFHTVGTTAVTNEDARSHVRYPYRTPAELRESLRDVETDTCVVFGRERVGLLNDELAAMDEVVSIPASEEYPVLNLGQAATVVLYELRELIVESYQHPDAIERADESDVEGLNEQFGALLDAINHPEGKRDKARRLFRRVVGRAHPTPREARTLRGILRRAGEYAVPPGKQSADED